MGPEREGGGHRGICLRFMLGIWLAGWCVFTGWLTTTALHFSNSEILHAEAVRSLSVAKRESP